MSWLSQWLKEIIMVILLAAFIDLLLPNRTMQRYVKLMMSLIILLILLSPIMKLFDSKITEELAAEWEKASANTPGAFESLTSIQREASRLTSVRNAEVMKVAATQLEANMKVQLREALATKSAALGSASGSQEAAVPALSAQQMKQADISSVAVEIAHTAAGEPKIASVGIILRWRTAAEAAGDELRRLPQDTGGDSSTGTDAIAPVENVQPVTIQANPNIQLGEASKQERHEANNSSSRQGREATREMEKEQKRMAEAEVIRLLTTQWLVSAEQVKVQWE
ncbi:stage III sporulation protein AF [Paenibacillus marinisediminis]